MHGTGKIAPSTNTSGQNIASVNTPSDMYNQRYDLEIAHLAQKLIGKMQGGLSFESGGLPNVGKGESILDSLKKIFGGADNGILTDEDIKVLCQGDDPMITPFVPEQVRVDEQGRRIMSYGLSSMGYDVRLQPKFKIFSNTSGSVIDPLNMSDRHYDDVEPITDQTGTYIILPSGGYMLGVTEEYFDMPPDTLAICLGKSTGARAGILVNTTPIEPGFKGNVVVEISNPTPSPVKIYANMGISQFLYLRANKRCRTSYGDRGGKYQGQSGIQTAIV